MKGGARIGGSGARSTPHAHAEENIAQRKYFTKIVFGGRSCTKQIITKASVQIRSQVVIKDSA
jgi:hypothetical protein